MKGDKTELQRATDADSAVFEKVADVLEFGDIKKSKETFDDTTFDDADGYARLGSGEKKIEPFDVKIKYVNDAVVARKLSDDFEKDEPHLYRLVVPTDPVKTKEFSAIISSTSLALPRKENITETVTIAPSGKFKDIS